MKASELRGKSADELQGQLVELKKNCSTCASRKQPVNLRTLRVSARCAAMWRV